MFYSLKDYGNKIIMKGSLIVINYLKMNFKIDYDILFFF